MPIPTTPPPTYAQAPRNHTGVIAVVEEIEYEIAGADSR